MYQGLFYFKTYVISFKNKLTIEKRFKSLNKIFINKKDVITGVE